MESTRRLAAIMFTDIAGFTQLSSDDEKAALHLIETQRLILQPIVALYDGSWLKEMGDGLLISFPSSTSAVQCAIKIQKTARKHPNLNLRIGIHQGDVVLRENDVFGDDVNIAARIEALAPVGGIAISHKVQGDISGNPEFRLKYAGRPKMKGVKQKVEIYCIISHGLPSTLSDQTKGILERGKYAWLVNTSLLVALLLTGWYFLENSADQINRIAVLPLRNLSNDPDQAYFSDEMTIDLIKALSSYGPLQIIQRQSIMQYKDSDLPFSTIAGELNADALIVGDVSMNDNGIEMSVRLIRADGEEKIWEDEFHQELSGVMALYGEVAKRIVEQIKSALTSETENRDPQARVDPKAVEAYWKGRSNWDKFTPQSMALAVEYYEKAIEIEPNYAEAYVGYADALATPAHMGLVSPSDVYPAAQQKLLHALELDEHLAEAHDLMARINFAYHWSPATAEKGFLKTIDLKPSLSDVRIVYSQLLSIQGRMDEAVFQARTAVELDPMNLHPYSQLAQRLAESGKMEEAIEMMLAALEKAPNSHPIQMTLWNLYVSKGDFSNALNHAKRSFELMPQHEFAGVLADKRPDENYQSVMRRVADLYVARADSMYISPFNAAIYYGHAGEVEITLNWLDKALDARESSIVYSRITPAFKHLRSHERFLSIIQKTNMSQ